jgi:hypothetical protein
MGYTKKIKTQAPAIEKGIETANGTPVRANVLQTPITQAVVAAMARNFSNLENIAVCCLVLYEYSIGHRSALWSVSGRFYYCPRFQ